MRPLELAGTVRGTVIGFLQVAVATLCVGLLASGSCHFHSCHDHDHDGRCDDDHHLEGGESGGDALELERYALVPSDAADRHPVRAITRIEGIGFDPAVTENGAGISELRDFTGRLFRVNPDLLGLRSDAGALTFDGVRAGSGPVAVHWRQTADHFDVPEDAGVRFVFDALGRLRHVDNTTMVPPMKRRVVLDR